MFEFIDNVWIKMINDGPLIFQMYSFTAELTCAEQNEMNLQ